MHRLFYPVNGENHKGKHHRDLLTLTPVVIITIQSCILRIDQSAALRISKLVKLSAFGSKHVTQIQIPKDANKEGRNKAKGQNMRAGEHGVGMIWIKV